MTTTRESVRPFRLDVKFGDPFRRGLMEAFGPAIEKAFALSELNDIYADVAAQGEGRPFLERALEALNVVYQVSAEDLEYQKSYSPLLLLWKGIGQYMGRHPQYMVMFGPVSINNQYDSISRELIMRFLEENNSLPEISAGVRAKNPPRAARPTAVDLRECSTVVRNVEEVSDLVAEIEADQKGLPILLKQYMKLGGKILGFNIDPDFGDVLDGLMLVDLRTADLRLIQKFAGAEYAGRVAELQGGGGQLAV